MPRVTIELAAIPTDFQTAKVLRGMFNFHWETTTKQTQLVMLTQLEKKLFLKAFVCSWFGQLLS